MDILAPGRTPETRVEDIYKGFAGLIELGVAPFQHLYLSQLLA